MKQANVLYDRRWLANNLTDVREKLGATQPIREEVDRLREVICQSLELKEVLWDCGWNIAHFRGCLQSFLALIKHHHSQMETLKGTIIIIVTLCLHFFLGKVEKL